MSVHTKRPAGHSRAWNMHSDAANTCKASRGAHGSALLPAVAGFERVGARAHAASTAHHAARRPRTPAGGPKAGLILGAPEQVLVVLLYHQRRVWEVNLKLLQPVTSVRVPA